MAAALRDKPPLGAFENFCYATLSPMVAGCLTNPAEVARVRMQVDTTSTGPRSSIRLISGILRTEGFRALYKGMQVTWLRDGSKGFFRLGLYDPVLSKLHQDQTSAPTHKRLIAGAVAGATGAFACNPFDVVKTKIQASTTAKSAGIWQMLRKVAARDGLSGLYRGSGLSMLRSVIGNSTNLTVFTLVKEYLIDERGFLPGLKCDVIAAMTAGFASSIAMNPVEVLRTRVYNAVAVESNQQTQSIAQTIRKEGFALFRKGLWPAFLRQGYVSCNLPRSSSLKLDKGNNHPLGQASLSWSITFLISLYLCNFSRSLSLSSILSPSLLLLVSFSFHLTGAKSPHFSVTLVTWSALTRAAQQRQEAAQRKNLPKK